MSKGVFMPRLNQRCRGEFSVREGIQRSDLGAKPPFDPRFRFATSWLVDARSLWILRGLIVRRLPPTEA